MQLKHVYLGLTAIGTALPVWLFMPFVLDHGLNVRLFLSQLFANPSSSAISTDVFISSAVLWTLVLTEGRRKRVQHLWAPLVGNLLVGVSLGLPLFLYLRERSNSQAAS